MTQRPTMPRICRGIDPAYPQREELSASEAGQKLREAVKGFLEEAEAWDRGIETNRQRLTARKRNHGS